MTPEQRRILGKLEGRVFGHVDPAQALINASTPWRMHRYRFGLKLMIKAIGPIKYAQIWRDRDNKPLAGLSSEATENPISGIRQLVADFNRIVNEQDGRLLDGDTSSNEAMKLLAKLEHLLAQNRNYPK